MHVVNVNTLERSQADGRHQISIHRQTALVVKIGINHRGPVNLGFQHGLQHNQSILFGLFSVTVPIYSLIYPNRQLSISLVEPQ